MHDGPPWPCIFGCQDARDELNHYLLCPVLWQLVREQIGPVDSLTVGDRLCLAAATPPSRLRLRQLALAHLTYHSCRSDKIIISLMDKYCRIYASPNLSPSSSDSDCSSYSSSSSTSTSNSSDNCPWPIVQSRAVGHCRAGVSLVGLP